MSHGLVVIALGLITDVKVGSEFNPELGENLLFHIMYVFARYYIEKNLGRCVNHGIVGIALIW